MFVKHPPIISTMKLKFLSVFAALSLLVSVSACEHSNNDVKPTTKLDASPASTKIGKVTFTEGSQGDLAGTIEVVKKSQSSLNKSSSFSKDATPYGDFDMSKVTIVQVSGSTAKAYVFKELVSVGDKQKTLAVYNYGQPDARAIVVETSSQAIEYIDYVNGDKTVVTNEQGVIQVKSVALNVKKGVGNKTLLSGCGDGTAHCIQDAYSNHGWISVWAFVQTAFIPWTAAGIAAACAVHNC